MMTTIQKIQKYLDDNKIVYYKRELSNSRVLFQLPYSLTLCNYKLTLTLRADDENMNKFELGFTALKKPDKDIDSELLTLNSKIVNGFFSNIEGTNEISYFAEFEIKEDRLTDNDYKKAINFCFAVFLDLIERGIINKEAYRI